MRMLARAARSRGRSQRAGSASSGSKASSAAPTQRGIVAERRRDELDEAPRGAAGRAGRAAACDGRLDERVQPLEQAAEDDEPRVEDVDQPGQPEPEPAADLRRAPRGPAGSPASAAREDRVDPGSSAVDRAAGAAQQGDRADLRLPAADRAAAAAAPAGLTGMWPISPP